MSLGKLNMTRTKPPAKDEVKPVKVNSSEPTSASIHSLKVIVTISVRHGELLWFERANK